VNEIYECFWDVKPLVSIPGEGGVLSKREGNERSRKKDTIFGVI
jgi:hypothetical protein